MKATALRLLLILLVVAIRPVSLPAQGQPPVPQGWIVIDDMIVPEAEWYGDSGFSGTPWPGGVVYFTFDPNLNAGPNTTIALDAMCEWAAIANVTFTPRTTQPNWVNFAAGSANLSYVGMVGGKQDITIFNWSRFIVCHEIAHALGCLHEQQRPNRDTYVTINYVNILPNNNQNFDIMPTGTMYGAYDFDSLMHYGGYDFTSNGLQTITCKPGYTQYQNTMGQRMHMSTDDALGMAARYGTAQPPLLGGIGPLYVNVGSPQFTLWVVSPANPRYHAGTTDGLGVAGTRVTWNGTPLQTTYFDMVDLYATVPASLLTTAGYVTVRVDNPYPGPGLGGSATFEIRNPAPALTSISPTSTTAGTAAFTLTANGSNFTTQSTIRWNGTPLTTTYLSGSQISASIPASLITQGGYAAVTVNSPLPGGGTSTSQTLTINNPVPAIGSMSPSACPAGSAQFNVTVYYTAYAAYVPQSVVRWNGIALPTTYQGNHLTATVSAGFVTSPGTAAITVFNPAPGGGTSNTATFSVTAPAPTLTSINPSSVLAGSAGFTLTANGAFYNTQSVVDWNGVALPTTYVSVGQLTATVGAALVATAGTASVTVQNPAPGGGTSAAQTFTVNNPAPDISSISPTWKLVDSSPFGFTLTVNGSGFTAQSVVQWDGANRPTTYVSPIKLTASIAGTLISSTGTASITVQTPAPGGGTSGSATFMINAPVPSISSVNPDTFNAGGGATTFVVNGNNINNQTVIRWNGADIPTTYTGLIFQHVTGTIDASLIAAPGTVLVTLHNPGPNNANSSPVTVTILAPAITSISPASMAVMTPASPPVTVTVAASHTLGASSAYYANGVALPSAPAAGGQRSIQIGPSIPGAQVDGAIAITVENGSQATSNATALIVGASSNAGTIVTHPSLNPLPPGTPFSLVLEGGVAGAPFSLFVDSSTAPVTTSWPTSAANFVLGIGTTELTCPLDGMGIFQAPMPSAVLASSPASASGSFEIPGLSMPNPPLGISFVFQFVYLDPTSPTGFRLSWTTPAHDL